MIEGKFHLSITVKQLRSWMKTHKEYRETRTSLHFTDAHKAYLRELNEKVPKLTRLEKRKLFEEKYPTFPPITLDNISKISRYNPNHKITGKWDEVELKLLYEQYEIHFTNYSNYEISNRTYTQILNKIEYDIGKAAKSLKGETMKSIVLRTMQTFDYKDFTKNDLLSLIENEFDKTFPCHHC